ncbi:MAG: ABC transporter permease subunit [OM182 bacterium]|nr:MAG: ABC transporter permease subunit [OM182 bacterium]
MSRPGLGLRLMMMAVTLLAIITLVFGMMRLAPGGPFDGERDLPPEIEANLKAAYHLDEPIVSQYFRYLGNLIQGDLGPSFRHQDFRVNELIAAGLPTSALLGTLSLLLALSLGLSLGVFGGMNPGSTLDNALMGFANLSIAAPTIITAPLMVLVFSIFLSWFPAGGDGGLMHYILPSMALALPFAGAIARLVRAGVIECRLEPYIVTARAKGLPERRIVYRHILPIAILPVLSFLGPMAAALLTGSIVIEQVFDLPGIGRYFVQAALNRDYTLVMGMVLVYSTLIVLFNFLVDLAYAWLDPRLKGA